MTSSTLAPSGPDVVAPAIDVAVRRIPPLWPLKHFVAVNPFLGLLDRPFPEACAVLQRAQGAAPLLKPADYLAAYRSGEISAQDLAAETGPDWTVERLLQELEHPDRSPDVTPLATVADLLDAERPRAHWSAFISDEISKWCGVTFDDNQTTWRSPWRELGLFAAWREAAIHDGNPEAFGLTDFRTFAGALPTDGAEAIAHCVGLIAPPYPDLADFLHRQLATISGWAGYAQYLVREDQLRGRTNHTLRDLLAIRLAYDAALYRAFSHEDLFRANWRNQQPPAPSASHLDALSRWQQAYERGYQQRLGLALAKQTGVSPMARPAFQAIFCIDVRSEVFRRHLESAAPGVQTIGFAGFFGFPIAHRLTASDDVAARCPVLLVPPVESGVPLPAHEAEAESAQRAGRGAWKAFQNSAASCFSFVESIGLTFAPSLARQSGGTRTCSRVAPALSTTGTAALDARTQMAEGALRNMSLTRNFARLILICGHGSESANNPYASGLDCGACGGHAGDVNARLAASALNDPIVRARLWARGIFVPSDTVFVAGLHNTTTDDVELFDVEQLPGSHHGDLARLRAALTLAAAGARRERAPALGLSDLGGAALDRAVRARGRHIAQVRPEWGLANNAAFVAAPRRRTASLNLHGRVFLHDYDATTDGDGEVLNLILCAPVVVASWINLQYYASRVDPARYGAGNKVLHNIAGGIGALEGNGGDLRVGLPLQSIHDGEKFMHEPRRLSVFIEAPRARIDRILARNPEVRQLFDHRWIHLFAIEGDSSYGYTPNRWRPLE